MEKDHKFENPKALQVKDCVFTMFYVAYVFSGMLHFVQHRLLSPTMKILREALLKPAHLQVINWKISP
jgi:hypothetical protein